MLSVLYGIHRLAYLTDTLVEGALREHPISGTEFALYSTLSARGQVTISELSDATAIPLPTTSKLLARAEDRGDIERSANPDDRRSSLIELSEFGRKTHAEALNDFMTALQVVLDDLGGAVADVRWGLQRMDDALGAALGQQVEGQRPAQPESRSLSYSGSPLRTDQEQQVREYIEYLQWKEQQ